MLTRNREVARTVIAWLALTTLAAVLAGAIAGRAAAVAAGAAGLVTGIPFLILTWWRYRRIAALSARVDAVLHGERALDLDRMEEGELAILASELDKMVTRLNLTADELKGERRALADALADISHQIKTPLTSLALSTDLVRRRLTEAGRSPEEVARLRQIQELEMRIERLVSALLKLARIDAGVVHLARQRVDVADVVREAAAPLAVAFDIADVACAVDVDQDASFTGDAAWSAEALGNILKNCLEHTPAGGTVTVRAHEDALACRIVIEDTGPGIAEADLPHIFERFYRGGAHAPEAAAAQQDEAPSQVNPAGVGIGLALARSLITAQEGTLTAENARDAQGRVTGARFSIAFFKAIV